MARTVRDAALETRTARARLKVRGKPYYRTLGAGLHVGYRKGKSGGRWLVRLYLGGQRYHLAALSGVADDVQDADGVGVFSFAQAQAKAREMAKQGALAPLTVEAAIVAYEADVEARGGDRQNVDMIRRNCPKDWLPRTVASLTSGEFRTWRNKLRKSMAASSVNRAQNAVRAMLNLAAGAHDLPRPWRTGLAAIPGATRANNVILNEATVRAIVEQAYVPSMGNIERIRDPASRSAAEDFARQYARAFGLLVEVIATTGTRPSQAARLTVGDLPEIGEPRLMMPSSRKGKGTKQIVRRPVPIPRDLMARLREAAGDRSKNAPLLVRPGGGLWRKTDHIRRFRRTAKLAGAEASIYALRHSSIARQLLKGVPVRVVAALHDTSSMMIERHYAELIADHADALARATLLDFSAVPGKGNVARLRP
jgi:integrase